MMIVLIMSSINCEKMGCARCETYSDQRFDVQIDDVHYRIYRLIVEFVLKCTLGVLMVKPAIAVSGNVE